MNFLSSPPVPAVAVLANWSPAFVLQRESLRLDDPWAGPSQVGANRFNFRSNRT